MESPFSKKEQLLQGKCVFGDNDMEESFNCIACLSLCYVGGIVN